MPPENQTAAAIQIGLAKFRKLSDRDKAFFLFYTALAERHGGSVTLSEIRASGQRPDYSGSNKPDDVGAVKRLREAGLMAVSDEGHRLTPLMRGSDVATTKAIQQSETLLDARSKGPSTAQRRVWLRAFWGFGPENAGYLGFTAEGNRDRFIREYQDGDLVLIYGADTEQTRSDQRRQVLGFLEIEPTPILDVDRSSEDERLRKVQHGWQNRWVYAVPVKRAWRVVTKIEVHHLARRTFQTHNPSLIASRCELLVPEEARRVLELPVASANVFGEPPLTAAQTSTEIPIKRFFEPSRGVSPSFGERIFTVEDSENRLYVLTLEGDTSAFLGRSPNEVYRKTIVKVGHAKEPRHRCDAHNAHLPTDCAFKWKVAFMSRPFPNGEEAKLAEDRLKARFAERFISLGREFFLADDGAVQSEFAQFAPPRSRVSGAQSSL